MPLRVYGMLLEGQGRLGRPAVLAMRQVAHASIQGKPCARVPYAPARTARAHKLRMYDGCAYTGDPESVCGPPSSVALGS